MPTLVNSIYSYIYSPPPSVRNACISRLHNMALPVSSVFIYIIIRSLSHLFGKYWRLGYIIIADSRPTLSNGFCRQSVFIYSFTYISVHSTFSQERVGLSAIYHNCRSPHCPVTSVFSFYISISVHHHQPKRADDLTKGIGGHGQILLVSKWRPCEARRQRRGWWPV